MPLRRLGVFILPLALLPVFCRAAAPACPSDASLHVAAPAASCALPARVDAGGRAPFHTLPVADCRSKKLFLVPGDAVCITGETGAFAAIRYTHPVSAASYSGWIENLRVFRLPPIIAGRTPATAAYPELTRAVMADDWRAALAFLEKMRVERIRARDESSPRYVPDVPLPEIPPDSGGFTPLMLAAAGCAQTVLDGLLSEGASVDAVDEDGRSALIYAVEGGCTEAARELLAYNADVDLASEGGTALMAAVGKGDLPLVELLAPYSKRIGQTNAAGESALSLARRPGREAILEFLLHRRSTLAARVFAKGIGIDFEKAGERYRLIFYSADAVRSLDFGACGYRLVSPQDSGHFDIYLYRYRDGRLVLQEPKPLAHFGLKRDDIVMYADQSYLSVLPSRYGDIVLLGDQITCGRPAVYKEAYGIGDDGKVRRLPFRGGVAWHGYLTASIRGGRKDCLETDEGDWCIHENREFRHRPGERR